MTIMRKVLVLLSTAGGVLLAAACADSVTVGKYIEDASVGPSVPPLTPRADADVEAGQVLTALCEGTECPYPYATCGTTETLRCGVNLSNDANNCGACGNVCPSFDKFNATSRCVDGACVLQCGSRIGGCSEIVYQDCNGFPDDGCEAVVSDDPKNCGTCGHVCDEGQACIKGKCGCGAGLTYCPGCSTFHPAQCVDSNNDEYNCGGCNVICAQQPLPAEACSPLPPGTVYGCRNGACGALKCGPFQADCNQDINTLGCESDGCEVDLSNDPLNCGACGNVCAPGKECRDDGNGPECLDSCETQGRTMCPGKCVDLLSDPQNCGNCDFSCDSGGNRIAQCVKGICQPKCADGFADCDGNPNNGCEVKLSNDPTNCGSCGVTCDFVKGQPCVEGKCHMVECDAGITTK